MYPECENEDHESQYLAGDTFTTCWECEEEAQDRADDYAFEAMRDARWDD